MKSLSLWLVCNPNDKGGGQKIKKNQNGYKPTLYPRDEAS